MDISKILQNDKASTTELVEAVIYLEGKKTELEAQCASHKNSLLELQRKEILTGTRNDKSLRKNETRYLDLNMKHEAVFQILGDLRLKILENLKAEKDARLRQIESEIEKVGGEIKKWCHEEVVVVARLAVIQAHLNGVSPGQVPEVNPNHLDGDNRLVYLGEVERLKAQMGMKGGGNLGSRIFNLNNEARKLARKNPNETDILAVIAAAKDARGRSVNDSIQEGSEE